MQRVMVGMGTALGGGMEWVSRNPRRTRKTMRQRQVWDRPVSADGVWGASMRRAGLCIRLGGPRVKTAPPARTWTVPARIPLADGLRASLARAAASPTAEMHTQLRVSYVTWVWSAQMLPALPQAILPGAVACASSAWRAASPNASCCTQWIGMLQQPSVLGNLWGQL